MALTQDTRVNNLLLHGNTVSCVANAQTSGRAYLALRADQDLTTGAGIDIHSNTDSTNSGKICLWTNDYGIDTDGDFTFVSSKSNPNLSATTGELRMSSQSGQAARIRNGTTTIVQVESTEILFSGIVRPTADNTYNLGTAAKRWKEVYAGTGNINTSDEREKEEIGAIPDSWLDAWGDVEYCRFKFSDAVRTKAEKGETARWHVGVIAQRVQAAFSAHGIDAFEIGLLCYDEWNDQFEKELDDRGELTGRLILATPAGNRFGIRADECLFMESAYLRRALQRAGIQVGRTD
jgi:hypothetical protein